MKNTLRRLTSRANPEINAVAQLTDAQERYAQKKFIAHGWRSCSTLIESGMGLVQLYVDDDHAQQALRVTDASHITLVNQSILKKISPVASPSGILGVFMLPAKLTAPLQEGIVLINVTDPGNMGTLIRTCAAMGKKTVVVINGVDPWNNKVIQASAGTIGYVHLYQLSWPELLKQKNDLLLSALVVEGGTTLKQASLKNSLLLIGSEAHGIPHEWLTHCHQSITLAMPGKTESLNAAIAGSIAMYIAWTP